MAKDTPAEKPEQDDEIHQHFREALERKKAAQHRPTGDGTGSRGVGPASNDKRTRQFRRKSGG
jgi:adenylosuccinate synthase